MLFVCERRRMKTGGGEGDLGKPRNEVAHLGLF